MKREAICWDISPYVKNPFDEFIHYQRAECDSLLPNRWRSVSSRSADSNRRSSRPWIAVSASRWCLSQLAYSSLLRTWIRNPHTDDYECVYPRYKRSTPNWKSLDSKESVSSSNQNKQLCWHMFITFCHIDIRIALYRQSTSCRWCQMVVLQLF